MPIAINEGTQTTVNTTLVGGTETQVIRLDVGSGTTAAEFGGTITAVANLAKGTITKVEGGTVGLVTRTGNVGTIESGTVDAISQLPPNNFATVVTTGTNTLGTIRAGVAGSVIYVTDLIISVGSATNVEIGNGGTANNIAGTFYFNANGGVAMTGLRVPLSTSAGSALVYKQSTGGPMSITALGYVK